MNMVDWLSNIMVRVGAEWVMWLMFGLSAVSIGIIVERAWFFRSLGDDLNVVAALDDQDHHELGRELLLGIAAVVLGVDAHDPAPGDIANGRQCGDTAPSASAAAAAAG